MMNVTSTFSSGLQTKTSRMTRVRLILLCAGLCMVAEILSRNVGAHAAGISGIKTVFVIMMENHDWSTIKGNAAQAPYINNTILPMASRAENYRNGPSGHPSVPNYLWLESGQCFSYCGTDNDPAPAPNGLSTAGLHTLLKSAGISWTGYIEGMTDGTCPMTSSGNYTVHHNPFVYYNDVSQVTSCPQLKDFNHLSGDLASNTVSRYNVIIPDKCNDMHDDCYPTYSAISQGDAWLANVVPAIMQSQAYRNNGAIFITWDEGLTGNNPLGMIVISPLARGHGYSNTIAYTHSSTLRTMEEIFNVSPLLGASSTANDLADLFANPTYAGKPHHHHR